MLCIYATSNSPYRCTQCKMLASAIHPMTLQPCYTKKSPEISTNNHCNFFIHIRVPEAKLTPNNPQDDLSSGIQSPKEGTSNIHHSFFFAIYIYMEMASQVHSQLGVNQQVYGTLPNSPFLYAVIIIIVMIYSIIHPWVI